MTEKKDKLVGADDETHLNHTPGTLGGYRDSKLRLYGRLDGWSALHYIAKARYVKNRVFFSDEATAIAAAYPLRHVHAREVQGADDEIGDLSPRSPADRRAVPGLRQSGHRPSCCLSGYAPVFPHRTALATGMGNATSWM